MPPPRPAPWRPGDGSYATLESSVSTAVKLSMVNRNDERCGGQGNKEMLSKALPWAIVNAIPFAKLKKTSDLAQGVIKARGFGEGGGGLAWVWCCIVHRPWRTAALSHAGMVWRQYALGMGCTRGGPRLPAPPRPARR